MGKKLSLVDMCTYETDEDGKVICCRREYEHAGKHFLDWYEEVYPTRPRLRYHEQKSCKD